MSERFQITPIDGGLRFTASDGWVDLELVDDERARLWCGTYNGTLPEVFGARLWHLLSGVMPELGLRVIRAETSDAFVSKVLLSAGFKHDGWLRSWGPDFKDLRLFSILATEVRYEVRDAEGTEPGANGPDTPSPEGHADLSQLLAHPQGVP